VYSHLRLHIRRAVGQRDAVVGPLICRKVRVANLISNLSFTWPALRYEGLLRINTMQLSNLALVIYGGLYLLSLVAAVRRRKTFPLGDALTVNFLYRGRIHRPGLFDRAVCGECACPIWREDDRNDFHAGLPGLDGCPSHPRGALAPNLEKPFPYATARCTYL